MIFRPFKAKQLGGVSTLPASYAELRHHLYEAGRIHELPEASERVTKYALSQIGLVTQVPASKEALEERIALLLAMPVDQHPKVLEYHLARCLTKRSAVGDKERSLKHARQATGHGMPYDLWLLLLNLEYEIHGIDSALPVVSESRLYLSAHQNISAIYQRGAELLVQSARTEDAINLLKKGVDFLAAEKTPPLHQSRAEVVQACAELLEESGHKVNAIELLQQASDDIRAGEDRLKYSHTLIALTESSAGMMSRSGEEGKAISLLESTSREIPTNKNLFVLYQACAELMAKANRVDDAISLLDKGIAMPGMANRYVLYQTAIELVTKAGDYPRAEALVASGLATLAKAGRRKIAETALRLFSARKDTDAVRRLLDATGAQQLDPAQRALADYLLTRLSGDWAKAIEVAHKGHTDFPNYSVLRIHEVDARLALGQVKEADDLMKEYQVGGAQERDNPILWLRAYVSLIAGRLHEATRLAAMYSPRDFDVGRELDGVEMLRIWSVARNGMNGAIRDSFPGIVAYRQLNEPKTPAAENSPIAQTPKQPCVLAVATEWRSAYGGVSTFNRELCRAFAKEGYQVWCYVPEASADEISQVQEIDRVILLPAPRESQATPDARLRNRPALPVGIEPDLIISHDRITGPAATSLAENHFPNSKHLLFIHTAPKQIEWFKEQGVDTTATGTAELRRQLQIRLASQAQLVAGVGPKLRLAVANELHALTPPKRVLEFLPGLAAPFRVASHPPANECLVLGRAEDAELKGLDIAARAMAKLLSSPQQTITPKPVLIIRGAPKGTGDGLRIDLMARTQLGANYLHIREYSSDVDVVKRDMLSSALVLLPSRTEGFGLVALEAITLGIPVLVSDQSGLAETLHALVPAHSKNCVVHVSADMETDATAWERQMEFVLRDRLAAFARANELRNSLAPDLTWQKAVRTLIEAFSALSV